VLLRDAAELRLPVAVGDDVVDVALQRMRRPARLRGVEIDVARGAGRVVSVEDRLDRALTFQGLGDRGMP